LGQGRGGVGVGSYEGDDHSGTAIAAGIGSSVGSSVGSRIAAVRERVSSVGRVPIGDETEVLSNVLRSRGRASGSGSRSRSAELNARVLTAG
jgi:hypothetical protein